MLNNEFVAPSASNGGGILLTALFVALLAGGSVYVYDHWQQMKTTHDLQAQITSLQGRLASQSQSSPAAAVPSPTSTDSATYTNPAYGYSFHYPVGWTVQPQAMHGSGTDSQSPNVLNAIVDVMNGDKTVLTVMVTTKAKATNLTLDQFASTAITPLDMTKISNKQNYTIGGQSGIREQYNITDPSLATSGLAYFTEDSANFYEFTTTSTTESADVVALLASFKPSSL